MMLRTTFAILFMLHLDPELGTTDCTQQHQSLLHPERAVSTRKESRILREHNFEEMIEIQVGLIGLICTHVPLYLVPLPHIDSETNSLGTSPFPSNRKLQGRTHRPRTNITSNSTKSHLLPTCESRIQQLRL